MIAPGPATIGDLVTSFQQKGELAGHLLHPRALVALAPAGSGAVETAGRDRIEGRVSRKAASFAVVHTWDFGCGDFCVLGIRESDGAKKTVATCVSIRSGQVTRVAELATPRPVLWATAPMAGQGGASDVFHRYMSHLDGGDAQRAAECFSRNCVYSHPPYIGRPGDSVFRGRDELQQAFERRGSRTFVHQILRSSTDDFGTAIEGIVPEVRGTFGSFVGLLTVDGDGLIDQYMALYVEPGVPGGPDTGAAAESCDTGTPRIL